MQETVNYRLKKQEENEFYDVNIVNENLDTIDRELKNISNKAGDLSQLSTTQKTSLVAAINEVLSKFNSIKLEAENVTIADLENLFTATKVEGALSEVMKKAKANETSILTLQNNDGNLANLQTTNKTNLVSAINEIFTELNGQVTRGINISNNILDIL